MEKPSYRMTKQEIEAKEREELQESNGEAVLEEVNETGHWRGDKGIKYDEGKARPDLIPVAPLRDVARVFEFGARKYAAYNYRLGMRQSRIYSALQRHLMAYWGGEDLDQETGLPHLSHALCCLFMLDDVRREKPDDDDRPHLTAGQLP